MESVRTAFQLAYSIAKENEIEVSIPIKHIPDIERTRFEYLQFFGADELSKDMSTFQNKCSFCDSSFYTEQATSIVCPECVARNKSSQLIAKLQFIESFEEQSKDVHETAVSKGFYDPPPSTLERIALMHTELSEAAEAFRHGNPSDDKIPEFSGEEAELADTIIRIMDYSASKKYRLAAAILAKIEYNKSRPFKHGKKC